MRTFLTEHGWGQASCTPLAGDASARVYHRLHKGEKSAIVMQDPEGDVALFARLAEHLCGLGLSAPRIFAQGKGLLLLEDLGDALIARLCTQGADEQALYMAATDALIALHRHAPPAALPVAAPEHLAQMTDLALTHYAKRPDLTEAVQAAFLPALEAHASPEDVMILRDYHAQNILWLPERTGAARAGLLDFQDAMIGHRAYDLASLLRDARRDVGNDTAEACIRHYLSATGLSAPDFRASLAVLGAQRNLRILGVFARLAQGGKPHYLKLLPRVWAHMQADLTHPALSALKPLISQLPVPDRAHLKRLASPDEIPEQPRAVMLFAAGFGTRMGDLTRNRPKPLVQVGGKALIDHALDLTKGMAPRVVNTHYLADQIHAHLAGSNVTISHETTEILDTGGGLRQALPMLGNGPVFTLNSDAVFKGENPLNFLQEHWRPDIMGALLLCVPMERAEGRKGAGDFSLYDGRLRRGGDLVYTGAQIMRTDRLSDMPQGPFSLNLLWDAMAQDGRLFGVIYPGYWCDVGHPGGIALAEEMRDV